MKNHPAKGTPQFDQQTEALGWSSSSLYGGTASVSVGGELGFDYDPDEMQRAQRLRHLGFTVRETDEGMR